ncbi:MAG: hypothetical protein NWE89_10670 [Candidatus Bathyarchaeota archaeon]|nr:hypothetical protein [Candidatus Bathyarchaeota archaeon]
MSCAPEDRQKLPENMKQFKPVEGVEPLGLFFPRGSNYMYASITKYKDYATWEKYWAEIAKERRKGLSLITEETDMFFEEVQL